MRGRVHDSQWQWTVFGRTRLAVAKAVSPSSTSAAARRLDSPSMRIAADVLGAEWGVYDCRRDDASLDPTITLLSSPQLYPILLAMDTAWIGIVEAVEAAAASAAAGAGETTEGSAAGPSAADVLCELMGHEQAAMAAAEVPGGSETVLAVRPWTIETKYYTAQVHVAELPAGDAAVAALQPSQAAALEALVLLVDTAVDSTLAALNKVWAPFLDEHDPNVLMIIDRAAARKANPTAARLGAIMSTGCLLSTC